MNDWYVYMVRCRDNSLYTGITTDIERRFAEHQTGGKTAARYVKGRGPLELVFSYPLETKNIALSIENRIKRLLKTEKEALILDPALLVTMIEQTPKSDP